MKHLLLCSLILLFSSCESGVTSSGGSGEGGGGGGGNEPGDTFNVTTQTKTSTHPEFGNGSATGMVIDGDEGEELTLTRGVNYTFVANTSAAHPLYITDDSQGAGAGTTYAGGPSSHSGVEFTFTPNSSTPDTVYYQCTNHSRMGWIINIQDP